MDFVSRFRCYQFVRRASVYLLETLRLRGSFGAAIIAAQFEKLVSGYPVAEMTLGSSGSRIKFRREARCIFQTLLRSAMQMVRAACRLLPEPWMNESVLACAAYRIDSRDGMSLSLTAKARHERAEVISSKVRDRYSAGAGVGRFRCFAVGAE